MIEMETYLIVSDDLAVADLDGEMVVLDTESGQYYGLNEVGARILQLLEQPRQVADVIGVLQDEYEVEPEQLQSDALAFMEQLREHQMVRTHEPTA